MDAANMSNAYEDIYINNRVVGHQNAMNYLWVKCREIFRYEGLPLTLRKRVFERRAQENGAVVIYEHEGDLFSSDSPPTECPDVDGENTVVHITHRTKDNTERLTRTIGIDAVQLRNDADMVGLSTILNEFAAFQSQSKISMLSTMVSLRKNYFLQAKDENAYKAAVEFENRIRSGDTAVVFAEEFAEMEGINVHSTPFSGSPATQVIELVQYLQSYYFGELGININNNMKSQYVNIEETVQKSSGASLIAGMLQCRQEAVRDINALFGTNISVFLGEDWNDEQEQDNEPQVAAEGGKPGETEGADPTDGETNGGNESETGDEENSETDTEAEGGTEDINEPEPEISKEELIEATEALLGEDHDEETDNDPAAGSDSSESDDR